MELIERLSIRARGLQRLANGQSTGKDREGRRNVELKGTFNIRGVLTREYGPGMDGLALRNYM